MPRDLPSTPHQALPLNARNTNGSGQKNPRSRLVRPPGAYTRDSVSESGDDCVSSGGVGNKLRAGGGGQRGISWTIRKFRHGVTLWKARRVGPSRRHRGSSHFVSILGQLRRRILDKGVDTGAEQPRGANLHATPLRRVVGSCRGTVLPCPPAAEVSCRRGAPPRVGGVLTTEARTIPGRSLRMREKAGRRGGHGLSVFIGVNRWRLNPCPGCAAFIYVDLRLHPRGPRRRWQQRGRPGRRRVAPTRAETARLQLIGGIGECRRGAPPRVAQAGKPVPPRRLHPRLESLCHQKQGAGVGSARARRKPVVGLEVELGVWALARFCAPWVPSAGEKGKNALSGERKALGTWSFGTAGRGWLAAKTWFWFSPGN